MDSGKTAAQAEMFRGRLVKRYRHLRKWARRTGAGAYLLYDRDIPEIPLRAELYGEQGEGQAGKTTEEKNVEGKAAPPVVSLSLYRRPYEKDEGEERIWLDAMKAAAVEALDIAPEHIFLRERRHQRGLQQYEKSDGGSFTRVISENGLKFRVNLSDYLDTGLFLDRRLMRSLIRAQARDKRVLNLFAYTGSFSVYAAAGGACQTLSVDISNTYLDWAAANFALNGLYAEIITGRGAFSAGRRDHALLRADVLSFLDHAAGTPVWDIIILDPPAFSNSKKMAGTLDIRRDYEKLVSGCLGLLAPRGVLYLNVNVKGFKPEPHAAFQNGVLADDITEQLRDEDFRGKRIPAAWKFTLGSAD